MKPKTTQMVGWVMSALLTAFLLFSASGKFVEWEGKAEMFEKLGFTIQLMTKIGVVEAILAVMFLIPRTGFLAALLLTAYLGGATETHLRVGEPFFFPIIMGVFLWIAYGLRRPEVFSLAIGAPVASEKKS